jgi:hypothetical protein
MDSLILTVHVSLCIADIHAKRDTVVTWKLHAFLSDVGSLKRRGKYFKSNGKLRPTQQRPLGLYCAKSDMIMMMLRVRPPSGFVKWKERKKT